MDPLRLIGYWRNETHPELPDPRDLVDASWDEQERHGVACYLSRGTIARVFMGYSPCRMCDKRDNGDLEYTDGLYLWPSGLVHYIDEHSVRLPASIVEHAIGRLDAITAATVDQEWWLASVEGSA